MGEQREQSVPDVSRPGRSKHLISPSEARQRNPDFFANRRKDENWTLRVRHSDGRIEEFVGVDWEATSRFGGVRSAVVTKPDGTPDFDRPRYDEAPSVYVVAWGRDSKTREIKVAMISQARPHADNVFDQQSSESMVFEQIPMGFLDRVIGKDQIERLESRSEGAKRETGEETGATAIKDIAYPEFPEHYPNPTFVGTSSTVVFVEVDLEKINAFKIDRKEQIFNAEYIPLNELMRDIRDGKTERGYARMCTSNSAILIFLSGLKQYQNADRNQRVIDVENATHKAFKEESPEGYLDYMLRRSKINKPEAYGANRKRAQAFREKAKH